jgi:hypothetical protein
MGKGSYIVRNPLRRSGLIYPGSWVRGTVVGSYALPCELPGPASAVWRPNFWIGRHPGAIECRMSCGCSF